MTAETFVAETGWTWQGGTLFVNAADVIALLRAGGYDELADDLARVAADEAAEHEAGHR